MILKQKIEFIAGVIQHRPNLDNPVWQLVARIIKQNEKEFIDNFGTANLNEVIKIIIEMTKSKNNQHNQF